MKRSLFIAATTVAFFAAAPVYAALGTNGVGWNGPQWNGPQWNTNQTSAAAQPGLNLTFEGVTLSTGETVAAK